MAGYLRFEVPRGGPSGGSGGLRDVLRAHGRFERVNLIRVVLVHLRAPAGLLPWIAAAWPDAHTRRAVAAGLALWAMVFVGVVVAGVLEYKWYRRAAHSLEESGGSREDSG